ncbi:MAG: hypothetical protein KIH10_14840 [Candidatus Freyarchaeota archaeon]|nr:hypothetical protein [Candidatus Jordarchaeia archaeon]
MNKQVSLATLAARIGEFLKNKDFEAIKGQTKNGYEIFAGNSPQFKIDGYINVTIEGEPNNFSVKFEHCTLRKKRYFPVLFSTLIFGGYPLIKSMKSAEDWIRLKRDFWTYVDNVILQLTGSENQS